MQHAQVGESKEWSSSLTGDVLQVSHRQGFKRCILIASALLKDLMDTAAELIIDQFQKKAKVNFRNMKEQFIFSLSFSDIINEEVRDK